VNSGDDEERMHDRYAMYAMSNNSEYMFDRISCKLYKSGVCFINNESHNYRSCTYSTFSRLS